MTLFFARRNQKKEWPTEEANHCERVRCTSLACTANAIFVAGSSVSCRHSLSLIGGSYLIGPRTHCTVVANAARGPKINAIRRDLRTRVFTPIFSLLTDPALTLAT